MADKPSFTSRRGKEFTVDDIDAEISDASEKKKDTLNLRNKAEGKQRGSMKSKLPRNHKKIAIVSVSLVVVISVAVIGSLEAVALQYNGAIPAAKNDLETVTKEASSISQKNRNLSSDEISSVANRVNDIVGGMCRGGLLDNLAELYPRSAASLESCRSEQTKYNRLASSLYILEKQMRYLEGVSASFEPVLAPQSDQFAVLGAQQQAWQTSLKSLEKQKPTTSLNEVHDELKTHTRAIAENWSQLNSANNEQNSDAFIKAEQAIANEYEKLRAVQGKANAALLASQTDITTRYEAISR